MNLMTKLERRLYWTKIRVDAEKALADPETLSGAWPGYLRLRDLAISHLANLALQEEA